MNISKLAEIYEKNLLRTSGSSSGELQESRGYQIWDMDNPDADPSIRLPEVNFTELLSKLKAVRDKNLIVVVPGENPFQLELDVVKAFIIMPPKPTRPSRASFISIEDFKKMKRRGRVGDADAVMYNDVQAEERAARVADYDAWYTKRHLPQGGATDFARAVPFVMP